MDLLDLYYEHLIDVLMHDEFGQRVLVLPMSVAQADLLVVLVVQADRGVVEELYEVLKLDPKDAIVVFSPLVAGSELVLQVRL